MLGKRKMYKLDISGLEFWQRSSDDGSKDFQEIYKKQVCVEGMLILDKIGNPKSMPKTSGFYYMDLVTGRVVSIELLEDSESLVVYPSGIVIPKERFVKYEGNAYTEASSILDDGDKLEDYTKVSEEFLYDSYFCNIISDRDNLDEIPVTMVEEVIDDIRKSSKKDGKKLLKTSSVIEG